MLVVSRVKFSFFNRWFRFPCCFWMPKIIRLSNLFSFILQISYNIYSLDIICDESGYHQRYVGINRFQCLMRHYSFTLFKAQPPFITLYTLNIHIHTYTSLFTSSCFTQILIYISKTWLFLKRLHTHTHTEALSKT